MHLEYTAIMCYASKSGLDYDLTVVVDKPGDVLSQEDILAKASQLGRKIMEHSSANCLI